MNYVPVVALKPPPLCVRRPHLEVRRRQVWRFCPCLEGAGGILSPRSNISNLSNVDCTPAYLFLLFIDFGIWIRVCQLLDPLPLLVLFKSLS